MQEVTKEMGTMLYQGFRMKEIMDFLNIQEDHQTKIEYRSFLKEFQ